MDNLFYKKRILYKLSKLKEGEWKDISYYNLTKYSYYKSLKEEEAYISLFNDGIIEGIGIEFIIEGRDNYLYTDFILLKVRLPKMI